MVHSQEFSSIVKSPSDSREYRGMLLANKMKVLLISEPITDMSAASMTVATGKVNFLNYMHSFLC